MRLLRRSDIDHSASRCIAHRPHAVRDGRHDAVIATASHIRVAMMLTEEIYTYAEGDDTALISDLIDGSIGCDSQFHRTFGYSMPSCRDQRRRHRQNQGRHWRAFRSTS